MSDRTVVCAPVSQTVSWKEKGVMTRGKGIEKNNSNKRKFSACLPLIKKLENAQNHSFKFIFSLINNLSLTQFLRETKLRQSHLYLSVSVYVSSLYIFRVQWPFPLPLTLTKDSDFKDIMCPYM